MNRRLLGTLAAVALCVATMSVLFASGASAKPSVRTGAADSSPDIAITQSNQPFTWFCLPSFLALRQHVTNTPTTFVLHITAVVRPCDTVNANAVIYLMPSNGGAWPQTLDQKQPLTINRKGVTTVTFAKHCKPAQYDVIRGATPPTITPWGPWHGPPLFPFDFSTALQYTPGPDCVPGGECDDYTPSSVVASPSPASPGDAITVSGNGIPGDTVDATLLSSPNVDLGAASVDQNGQFTINGNIPGSANFGVYNITVTSDSCPTFSVISLIVGPSILSSNVASSAPPPAADESPVQPRVAAGLLAIAVGGLAMTRLSGRRARVRTSRSD